MATVLDASAFLAYLQGEPGADVVADAIASGTSISSANLAEVLSRVADRGRDPVALMEGFVAEGLLEGAVEVEPVTLDDAAEIARLRPLTRAAGLSLGDRACLALARRLGAEALTADAAWGEVRLDVRLVQIC
ncbi:type II toxin-antitoxin system VapC family toxin [Conexibacter sp. CPCC 206217]|uniref:type II toxin-antitoxin system VapC family toxin n=1 Tax=Conexibacter sp. CPCC 206217 TaxID=3064574 RepID=UPI002718B0D3|nr:type II toxin-antitoxin system VapC family toxin [Conexibacter sp. CPCC 206217]MDO8210394.1 type II toxin-antitoxin system VapC family toxin [Conexibacter sp. CPCC 206217]